MIALYVLGGVIAEIGFAMFVGRLLRGPSDRFEP